MILAFAFLLLGSAQLAKKNLVPNGDFEKGKRAVPLHWQRPDGLCSFWVRDKKREGYCLKIDTDVLKDQYRARQKELKKRPLAPPPKKKPTKGKKFLTVAAFEGVAYYSDWIAVKPNITYTLSVDVRVEKGRKTPKVFVKGYIEDKKRPPGYRRRVQYKKFLDCPASTEWKTFSMSFNPTSHTPKVKWIRVMLYAYWPPGTYYFDNVRVFPAEKEKAKKLSSKRKSKR